MGCVSVPLTRHLTAAVSERSSSAAGGGCQREGGGKAEEWGGLGF